MLKIILKILKRIIISSFLLYGYNLIVQPMGITIPINVITVSLLTILGVPALMALISVVVLIY